MLGLCNKKMLCLCNKKMLGLWAFRILLSKTVNTVMSNCRCHKIFSNIYVTKVMGLIEVEKSRDAIFWKRNANLPELIINPWYCKVKNLVAQSLKNLVFTCRNMVEDTYCTWAPRGTVFWRNSLSLAEHCWGYILVRDEKSHDAVFWRHNFDLAEHGGRFYVAQSFRD